jgi:hypothetical protein
MAIEKAEHLPRHILKSDDRSDTSRKTWTPGWSNSDRPLDTLRLATISGMINVMAYLSTQEREYLNGLADSPHPVSLRKHINLMCKECIYDTAGSGTWRQQVGLCTCDTCPLFKVRPRAADQSCPESMDSIGS